MNMTHHHARRTSSARLREAGWGEELLVSVGQRQLSNPTLSASVEAALRLAAIFEIGSASGFNLP